MVKGYTQAGLGFGKGSRVIVDTGFEAALGGLTGHFCLGSHRKQLENFDNDGAQGPLGKNRNHRDDRSLGIDDRLPQVVVQPQVL